ncbi:MAG: hypoxanthine phosphoribosyltransferase [Clostridia bacterium]|jgi:hypoxanthine phosphoribosyltransferase|nr:hypoxanthine phosphoribosyltransferase [Clostridia bacterium]
MEEKSRNILLSEDKIKARIKELGAGIEEYYRDKKLYVLSLLRGSFIFTADLVRAIDLPVKIGFMTTTSYGNNEESSGKVTIVNDLPDDIRGYDVLVVDDIIDTGITMKYILEYVQSKGAASVKSCSLLDKPERRAVEVTPDFCGFTIPDVFVVGYGLNYGDYYRNVPYVFNWEEK